jgi:hypothetical protein
MEFERLRTLPPHQKNGLNKFWTMQALDLTFMSQTLGHGNRVWQQLANGKSSTSFKKSWMLAGLIRERYLAIYRVPAIAAL